MGKTANPSNIFPIHHNFNESQNILSVVFVQFLYVLHFIQRFIHLLEVRKMQTSFIGLMYLSNNLAKSACKISQKLILRHLGTKMII